MHYTTDHALRLNSVGRCFGAGERAVQALDDVSLALPTGSFTAVMGPSGSGKSTLLQLAAGLDRPTSGSVQVDGTPLDGHDETALTKLRRGRIGFVFQHFNLLSALTALQNVALPLQLAGGRAVERRALARLADVDMADRAQHRPAELSGGEQQRVAIARALVAEPAILLADEPTGALDTRSAGEVLGLLRAAVRDHAQTTMMVTHDPVAAARADAVVFLADGRLAGRLERPTPELVAERMTHLADRVALPA